MIYPRLLPVSDMSHLQQWSSNIVLIICAPLNFQLAWDHAPYIYIHAFRNRHIGFPPVRATMERVDNQRFVKGFKGRRLTIKSLQRFAHLLVKLRPGNRTSEEFWRSIGPWPSQKESSSGTELGSISHCSWLNSTNMFNTILWHILKMATG